MANDDDEWNFSSALPPEVPQEHKALVSNTTLKIDMLANRTTSAAPFIVLSFGFSNNTARQVSELHFQLAVTKVRATPTALPRHRHKQTVLTVRGRATS